MQRMVFIIGTGRCGTDSLARLLDSTPGCIIKHEHEPVLLEEVLDYLSGSLSHDDMVRIIKSTRTSLSSDCCRIAGESNQRLSFVLSPLAEAFPGAKYIWLIRDARSTLSSMIHRFWYYDNEVTLRFPGIWRWTDDRIRADVVGDNEVTRLFSGIRRWMDNRIRADVVGEMSTDEWRHLSAFGRCAWYWSYTYRKIDADLLSLELDGLKIRLEDIDKRLPEIWEFLGLAGVALPAAVQRSNPARHGRPIKWQAWSSQERRLFERFCASLMDEHYPGWRAEWDDPPSRVRALAHRRVVESYRFFKRSTYPYRRAIGLSLGQWRRHTETG